MNNAEILNNYPVQVLALASDLGGGYEATFPLLARSVVGYGQTRQEAVDDLLESIPAFIEAINETGRNLPATEAPKSWDEFSGKFNVRVPKVLHAKLARLADEQGVSLNSIVQSTLMSGATALEAGHEFGAAQTKAEHDNTPPATYGPDRAASKYIAELAGGPSTPLALTVPFAVSTAFTGSAAGMLGPLGVLVGLVLAKALSKRADLDKRLEKLVMDRPEVAGQLASQLEVSPLIINQIEKFVIRKKSLAAHH